MLVLCQQFLNMTLSDDSSESIVDKEENLGMDSDDDLLMVSAFEQAGKSDTKSGNELQKVDQDKPSTSANIRRERGR